MIGQLGRAYLSNRAGSSRLTLTARWPEHGRRRLDTLRSCREIDRVATGVGRHETVLSRGGERSPSLLCVRAWTGFPPEPSAMDFCGDGQDRSDTSQVLLSVVLVSRLQGPRGPRSEEVSRSHLRGSCAWSTSVQGLRLFDPGGHRAGRGWTAVPQDGLPRDRSLALRCHQRPLSIVPARRHASKAARRRCLPPSCVLATGDRAFERSVVRFRRGTTFLLGRARRPPDSCRCRR